MANIRVLAFFWLARLHWRGGIAAWHNLPPRFFIGADDEASRLGEAQRMDIELTESLRLGLEVGIMAGEPVHTPMRLAVGLLQDTPDAGNSGRQVLLQERCDQVIKTPPGGGTMIRGRVPGRPRQHLDALRGGQHAVGGPSAGHPEAVEAVRQIALTPTAHRMALTGHLGGSLEIRWTVWRGGPEDQPTAKGEGLGSGMGAYQRLHTGLFLRGQGYWACNRHGHGQVLIVQKGQHNMR